MDTVVDSIKGIKDDEGFAKALNQIKAESESIEEFEEIAFETISSDFLSSKRSRFVKLLDAEQEPIKFGKKDNRIFEFDEVVYVRSISFVSGHSSRPNLSVEVNFADGTIRVYDKLVESKHSDNRNFINVNGFVKSFSVRSDRVLRDEKVSRVLVSGLQADVFHEIVTKASDFFDNYIKLKADTKAIVETADKSLTDIKTKKDGVTQTIQDLTEKQAEAVAETLEAQKTLEKVQLEITETLKRKESLEAAYSTVVEKEISVKNSVEELSQTKSNLNRQISDLKTDVATLSSRKDLYAENLASYTAEGETQLKIYYVLIALSLFALWWIGDDALSRINELISEYKVLLKINPKASSYELILLRIPYASIVLAVFGGFIALVNTLLAKVFEIHSQKRHFIGLSVLARDISSSSKHGLSLSDEQIYQSREQVKFELLSESMLGDTFRPVLNKRVIAQSKFNDGPRPRSNADATGENENFQ